MQSTAKTSPAPDLTLRATDELRELIAFGRLSPGEQVRQEDLATRLGVSRSPLREALRTLEQEGLLQHEPRRGYFVARLDPDELSQVYRMRELLERELLRASRSPSAVDLRRLRSSNVEIDAAMRDGSVIRMLRANRDFHFLVFALSPLDLVCREVQRLWRLSEPYQATYLWNPATRERIVAEHEAIVDALERGARKRSMRLLDLHREAARTELLQLMRAREAVPARPR